MKMLGLYAVLLAMPLAVMAGAKAHEHGVVRLDIGAEAGLVAIHLESPLDNLAGFERAPKNAAERQRLDTVLARLKAADTLFRFDAAARCSVTKVVLSSAALKLGDVDPKDAADGHADIDADYEFACEGAAPGYVETTLLEAMPRLQRVEVQAAGSKGQSRATLKRPERRITIRN
jgi:hypothetical protein